MDIGDSELFAAFGQSIDDLILRHCTAVETKRETVAPNGIYASRSGSDVDCNVSPVEH